MKKYIYILAAILMTANNLFAKKTITTVSQVAESVTISDNVDYHISSTTPFTSTGNINITNTDDAAIILDNIRPSSASAWLGYININGKAATKNNNCVIKIYKRGAIILPHGSNVQPLMVYSGEIFTGTSYNNFNVGTGYSLSSANLNNQITSFKLKRGYMAFVATKPTGYGYSRVFVAADSDRNISVLPGILYKRISYIKVFQWNDCDKKGYAGNDATANSLLGTTWCYNWDAGTNSWEDREYVTQHHHEGWPGISDVGNNGTSPNSLGNNEPDNTGDARETVSTVDEVLANWPAMMATGKRLGSPAMSSNLSGWLYPFIDSIDARGWRCDFIAVHAYWYSDVSSWLYNLNAIYNRTHRPIWITEMNYGANWTGWPGSDTNGSTSNYNIEKNHMGPILDGLNSAAYIERIGPYNWVQDCRKFYNTDDATLSSTNNLTPTGVYYNGMDANLAFNPTYEYVPTNPKYAAPSGLSASFKPSTSACVLTWTNNSGDYCDSIMIERSFGSKGSFETLATMAISENSGTYTYRDTSVNTAGTYGYRIHEIGYDKKNYYSNVSYNIISGAEGTSDVQYGTISASSNELSYNYFAEPFENAPAIVMGGTTNVNASLAPVEHVYTAYKTSGKYSYFTFNMFPWTLSGVQTFSKGAETTHYIAGKTGNGKIGDLPYEAGFVHNTVKPDSAIAVGNDTVYCKFVQPFAEGTTPVVFATPRYTSSTYPYMWRVWNVTNEGFKVILMRQKGLTYAGWPKQYVAYFAIAKGQSKDANGKIFTVGDTIMKFTSGATIIRSIAFGQKLSNPMALVQMQTLNRNCAGILRLRANGPTDSTITVRIQLDSTDVDNKTIMPTTPVIEDLGWITISNDTTTNGISIITNNAANKGKVIVTPFVTSTCTLIKDVIATKALIYNINGIKVDEISLNEGQATLDVIKLPSGIYIIRTNGNHSTKFIKQ